MLYRTLMLVFGPLGRTIFVGAALSSMCMCWNVLPQRPIETVREPHDAWPRREFGPNVYDHPKSSCGFFSASGGDSELPDHTWDIRYTFKDNDYRVWERGTGRELGPLPPGDYAWIAGSRIGRRMGAQVGEHYQVWDLEKGKLLYRVPCAGNACRFSPSGRHVLLVEGAIDSVSVVDVDHGKHVVRIPCHSRMAQYSETMSKPELDHYLWEVFSPDGRCLMLGVLDQQRHVYLWLWDLESKKPIWRKRIDGKDRTVSHFDASGRYFSLNSWSEELLIDVSTSPPTDLTAVMATDDGTRNLGDRRYVAFSPREHPTECRIWDLDRRKLLACHRSSKFGNKAAISPDNQFAIIGERGELNGLEQFVVDTLKWFGFTFPTTSSSYRVIDLNDGRVVNRLVGGDLDQFDPEIQHVWTVRGRYEAGDAVYEKFPLRSTGAPWWLWSVTIAGLTASFVDCFRGLQRKRGSGQNTIDALHNSN